jgi:hypothetical protein
LNAEVSDVCVSVVRSRGLNAEVSDVCAPEVQPVSAKAEVFMRMGAAPDLVESTSEVEAKATLSRKVDSGVSSSSNIDADAAIAGPYNDIGDDEGARVSGFLHDGEKLFLLNGAGDDEYEDEGDYDEDEVEEVAELCSGLVHVDADVDGLPCFDADAASNVSEGCRLADEDSDFQPHEVLVSFGRALSLELGSLGVGCGDLADAELVKDVSAGVSSFLLILPREHYGKFAKMMAGAIAVNFPKMMEGIRRIPMEKRITKEVSDVVSKMYKEYVASLTTCWCDLSAKQVLSLSWE